MKAGELIVWILLLGLITLVSLIISGLIFITEPLFKDENIILSNPNLGISKMAVIMSWFSLPITIFMTIQILIKILENEIGIIIVVLGLLLFLGFMLYGLSIISMGLFEQGGIYINNNIIPSPAPAPAPAPPTPTPTPPSPVPVPTPTLAHTKSNFTNTPHVYTDKLTADCMKLAIIFSWLSISWNIYFFIVKTSDF